MIWVSHDFDTGVVTIGSGDGLAGGRVPRYGGDGVADGIGFIDCGRYLLACTHFYSLKGT